MRVIFLDRYDFVNKDVVHLGGNRATAKVVKNC